MTFDDLTGYEFEHPEHGHLMIMEYNHAGQVFCYTSESRYVILQADDPALDGADFYEAEDSEIEFIDLAEEFMSSPDAKGILIVATETNDLIVKAKNLEISEGKEIIRTLDDIFSEPYEGRYNVN